MRLRIPGKTFLVGEYAVLVGGNALGLATEPYFIENASLVAVHAESAVGLYTKATTIGALENPYQQGGFGLSTAEFIAAWFRKNKVEKFNLAFLQKIFTEYRELFDQNEQLRKIKPSGADLVTQLVGGVTHFNQDVLKSKIHEWPFANMGFDIISTGFKVATHEHLENLDLNQIKDLPDVSHHVINAFADGDQDTFLSSLEEWTEKLRRKGLQHNHSNELVEKLYLNEKIMLAKPNGALGADTITVFYQKSDRDNIKDFLNRNKFNSLTSEMNLGRGAHYVD